MADQKQIIIYGAGWCSPCHVTKQYLDQKGFKYEYRDIDSNREWLEESVKKSGANSIPVIDIEGEIIIGFDRPRIDAALASAA